MQHIQEFSLRPYRRAWWLSGAHLQTIGGWLLRRRGGVEFRRERVDTPDGDFVDLDFVESVSGSCVEPSTRAPVIIVLHGLEGGSASVATLELVRALHRAALQAVVLNFRSCSGEANRAPRFYHAGDTDDLAHVAALLMERFPDVPFGFAGYSLGGNVLLKYLGERGASVSSRIRTAAAISVPFDLTAGARKLESGASRLYMSVFLRSLRRKFQEKEPLLQGRCDTERVLRSRTLREFDDAATAPLHGFAGAEEYYRASSSAAYLNGIRVPTLLLHAADDPFLPADAVPHGAAKENRYLTAGFTDWGGHVGFVSGMYPWAAEFWAETEAARFLARGLRYQREEPEPIARGG